MDPSCWVWPVLANRTQGYDSQLIEYLQPLFTSSGNILHAFRSEEEREQVQKALRESEARFKSLINSGLSSCGPVHLMGNTIF